MNKSNNNVKKPNPLEGYYGNKRNKNPEIFNFHPEDESWYRRQIVVGNEKLGDHNYNLEDYDEVFEPLQETKKVPNGEKESIRWGYFITALRNGPRVSDLHIVSDGRRGGIGNF